MAETAPHGNRSATRTVEPTMTALRTAAFAALLLLVTACAPGGTASGDPSASAAASPSSAPASPSPATSPEMSEASVAVVRSGGIAGVNDTFIVEPSGKWTATDRSGAAKSGQLNAQQRHELQRLAHEPKLAEESNRQRGRSKCNDAFTYTVTVSDASGQKMVGFSDCPSDENLPQTAMAIAVLVTGAANN
ncbi:protealysin inhibitor emfourin [Catellatospora sp. NPDC049609]|uniref:protealysin inhibitor emfourin n=1 Tax=Catellatospora sp. NPDC049609 TaxID=3155505 RepID=UPI0034268DCE